MINQQWVLPAGLATLPNFDSLIDAAGNDERMRPVEVDGRAEVIVSVEPFATPSVRHVPDPQRFVVAGGKQIFTARMPR
jgi:hypothetical protein